MTHYQEVKARVYQERMDFVIGTPTCEVCGLSFHGQEPSAHHAIISKQYARGWPPDMKARIDHEYNLALVHEYNRAGLPCHQIAHAKPIILVAKLIDFYGDDPIAEWLETFGLKSTMLRPPLSEHQAKEVIAFWDDIVMSPIYNESGWTIERVMDRLNTELAEFPDTAALFSRPPLYSPHIKR